MFHDKRERKGTNAEQGLNSHIASPVVWEHTCLCVFTLILCPFVIMVSRSHFRDVWPQRMTRKCADERWQGKQERDGDRETKRDEYIERGGGRKGGKKEEKEGGRKRGREVGGGGTDTWQHTQCCLESRKVWAPVPKSAPRLSFPR